MSKEKNKFIPELRFPEFANKGEWEKDIVDNLISTITPPKKLTSSNYFESGRFPIIDQSKSFYCGWTNDADAIIADNLPLIVFGDHTCILKMAIEPFAQGADGIKILKSGNKVTPEFLYHFLQYNEVKQEDYKRHFSILKEKNVFFPKKETGEQQKIASCLSSLDEVITAHCVKLELFKDHKKGLMQNLFPQDGEKLPAYRFQEFVNDGDWDEKPLKEVFSIFQGFAFSSDDSVPNGTRWLKIADVGIQQMKNDSPSYLPKSYREQFQKFLVKKGDYVLALTRPILNMELKIAPVDETFHNALLNQRVGKIVTTNDSSFVYYQLQTAAMVANINKNIAGNEPPNLSFQQIENIEVPVPKNPQEQRKIASCLSALDEIIMAHADKIDQLRLHKKGLMQGLFPKMTD